MVYIILGYYGVHVLDSHQWHGDHRYGVRSRENLKVTYLQFLVPRGWSQRTDGVRRRTPLHLLIGLNLRWDRDGGGGGGGGGSWGRGRRWGDRESRWPTRALWASILDVATPSEGDCSSIRVHTHRLWGVFWWVWRVTVKIQRKRILVSPSQAKGDNWQNMARRFEVLSLSGGFMPCLHLRRSSGREHTAVSHPVMMIT